MAHIFQQVLRQSMLSRSMRISGAPSAALRYYSGKSDAGTTAEKPETFDKETLDRLVRTNKVVIFMKGNPEAPRCGFSNAVVQILRMHGVPYDAHDVLQSEELRQSIKEFSEWPTIPQVYINGEFVGGCDILLQMHQSGDLIEELKKVGIESLLLKKALEDEAKDSSKKDDKK